MTFLPHNNILKKSLLSFMIVFALFAPVSATLEFNQAEAAEGGLGTTALNIIGFPFNVAINIIGETILAISSAFTWFGGKLLEYSLEFTVLTMGDRVNGTMFGGTIDTVWGLIRDISNLVFIFGFIYVGIRTIIDPESANTKRFLSKIIIGALLINFSLFFVKIIIDFSNFTALKIYSSMATGSGSLSTAIVDRLGIITFYNIKDASLFATLTSGKSFWFFIFGAIFLLTTAFVFIAASILLIIRFVALIAIMIASPILFAATVFPQTEHYASDLWKKLISYAFFAPAYLLFTLISLRMVEGMGISSVNQNFVNTLTNVSGSSYSVIFNFLVIIFFMIGSLVLAQKMGVAGGNAIVTKTKQLIGGATAGLAARTGRATVGRWAHNASESEGFKDFASRKGLLNWGARQALKGTRIVGDTSFDARNVAGAGKALGIGEGRKGGYTTVKKEVEEKEEKFAKSFGEIRDDDVLVTARKKEMGAEEMKLKELKEELKQIRGDDQPAKDARKLKLAAIEHQEHNIHEAKVKYETEKQRRIIGSTYAESKDLAVTAQIEASKRAISILQHGEDGHGGLTAKWSAYTDTPENNRTQVQRDALDGLMKNLQKAKDKHGELLSKELDRGYAGVLENSVWWKSWPLGRLVAYDKAAGKAVRKARKDGLPKEKKDHGGAHGGRDAHDEDDHGGGGGGNVPPAAAAPVNPPAGGGGGH